MERAAILRLAFPLGLSADAPDACRRAAFPLHRARVSPGERDRIRACSGVFVHSRTSVVPVAIAGRIRRARLRPVSFLDLCAATNARAESALCLRALELRRVGGL